MAKRYIKLIQVSGNKEREIGEITVSDWDLIVSSFEFIHEHHEISYPGLYEKLRGVRSAARQFWPEEE